MNTGFVQIYTGDGKGKTTAAIGLAVRAVGAGLKVVFIQFLKSGKSSEFKVLSGFSDRFKSFHFAKIEKFMKDLTPDEKFAIQKSISLEMRIVEEIVEKGECDVLILDEIFAVLNAGLIDEQQIIKIIERKAAKLELVLTGRDAPTTIIEKADLVTKMKPIKHYANNGVNARKGIEY